MNTFYNQSTSISLLPLSTTFFATHREKEANKRGGETGMRLCACFIAAAVIYHYNTEKDLGHRTRIRFTISFTIPHEYPSQESLGYNILSIGCCFNPARVLSAKLKSNSIPFRLFLYRWSASTSNSLATATPTMKRHIDTNIMTTAQRMLLEVNDIQAYVFSFLS